MINIYQYCVTYYETNISFWKSKSIHARLETAKYYIFGKEMAQ